MTRIILFIIYVFFVVSCSGNKRNTDFDPNLVSIAKAMSGDSFFSTNRILNGKMMITRVFHNSDRWYFGDDSSNIKLEERPILIKFEQLLKIDSSLIRILDMPVEHAALRKNIHDTWVIKQMMTD